MHLCCQFCHLYPNAFRIIWQLRKQFKTCSNFKWSDIYLFSLSAYSISSFNITLKHYVFFLHSGFTGTTCEQDIDECNVTSICGTGSCFNNIGSYSCSCPTGFDGDQCQNVSSKVILCFVLVCSRMSYSCHLGQVQNNIFCFTFSLASRKLKFRKGFS